MNIKGKKVLFIGTGFYDYELDIKKSFEYRGAEVYYFSSVLSSFILMLCNKLRLDKLSAFIRTSLIKKRIEHQPSNIDFVFIIKGENFNQEIIYILKTKYGKKPTVLYFWDSIKRMSNSELLLRNFDKILTFDRKDAIKYNLVFRPLFCRVIEPESNDYIYSVSFVGGIHSLRFNVVKKIKEQLRQNGLNYRFVLWISKRAYIWRRYIVRSISKEDEDLFTTKPIPYKDYIDISKKSKCILDISHPEQDGLTIRSIEAIGLGKKIITTNSDIINYEFNNQMYYVIDAVKPIIDIHFVNNNDCPGYDVSKYTIDSFIDQISDCFDKQ